MQNTSALLPKGSHIVVVGAGFAGIGASEHLLEAGYQVTQVEVQDYIGGRAKSQDMDGFAADLGANWLKPRDNALLPIAEANGLIAGITDISDGAVAGSGASEPVDMADFEPLLKRPLMANYISHHIRRFFGARPRVPSVQSLIGSTTKAAGATGRAVEAMLKLNYAANLDRLSGLVLLENTSEDMPVSREPTVVGGMQALAKSLVRRSSPVLNERVSVIARTNEGVKVTTDQRDIFADAVIVTVSVHVLKSGGISFQPGLPSGHLNALSTLEMGSFYKIWMRFPAANWSFAHTVQIIPEIGEVDAVVDFAKSHGAPVLLGIAAGSEALEMERIGKEAAAKRYLSVLKDVLGLNLPEPTHCETSSWGQNPFLGGAYAYPVPNHKSGASFQMREPVADRIFLAGEALDKDPGYVDTAWRDGRRAADLIIGA